MDDDFIYFKYYLDGPHSKKNITEAICFNEQGNSYQLRVEIDGALSEENPNLTNSNGIPLYKWTGTEVVSRSQEEINNETAQLPKPGPTDMDKLRADVDFLLVMNNLN